MTDKEMLKYAAKAIGYHFIDDRDSGLTLQQAVDSGPYNFAWNPLQSNSDAFNLAVKLKLNTYIIAGKAWACIAESAENQCNVELEDDPYAAQRRVIVMCAASIGRMMEEQENVTNT